MTSTFLKKAKKIKDYGVGLGLRKDIFEDTLKNKKIIDFLEIAPENYIFKGGATLERLLTAKKHFPIIPHGLNFSIGGTDPFDPELINATKKLFSVIKPPWFSDHLCFNYVESTYIHDLIPLPYTKSVASHVADRVKKLEDIFQIPFLIENPSYYMIIDSDLDEATFLTQIVEEADCGLLLDINNVYVNSKNHNYDPIKFLEDIPIERTLQVHIAGHFNRGKIIIDTHGEAIIEEVFDLLGELVKRCEPKAILLERDFNFPDISELLSEIKKIKSIVKKESKKKLVRA